MKKTVLLLLLATSFSCAALASHLKGGYIRLKAMSATSYTCELEFVGYNDSGSSVAFGSGEVDFGDGTRGILREMASTTETVGGNDQTTIRRFVVRHAFQAPGTYTVSFTEFYRNAGVVNMEGSVATPFHISTTIVIDPLAGANTTPSLFVQPALVAKAGSRFYSSLACTDAEGDSLVYSLAVPAMKTSEEVMDFRWPNHPDFYDDENRPGQPVFAVDRLSGLLTWDAPQAGGEFAAAYKVLEYRKVNGAFMKVSETTFDLMLVNRATEEVAPDVVVEHNASGGAVTFSMQASVAAHDSLAWEIYSSGDGLTIDGAPVTGRHAGGKALGALTVQGSVVAMQGSERPLVLLVAVRQISSPSGLTTVKSYAIHPNGGQYVLTSAIREALSGSLVVFPNPAATTLSLQLPEQKEMSLAEVEMVDMTGQSILKTAIPIRGNLATLDVHELSEGVYFVRTYLGGKVYFSRFIKE